ncbi:2TM domain-containing protein [Cellulophaga sp. F20128]|nr:2TM domain-containing protein [Cellulophaga sp. F20128]
MMEGNDSIKLERAKKRVEKIKGFYIHFTVYILVNLFIVGSILYNSGWDDFFHFGTFFTPFFWGIGVLAHYSKAFGYMPFFGKNWEQRQIEKYMEKDKRESDEFINK